MLTRIRTEMSTLQPDATRDEIIAELEKIKIETVEITGPSRCLGVIVQKDYLEALERLAERVAADRRSFFAVSLPYAPSRGIDELLYAVNRAAVR